MLLLSGFSLIIAYLFPFRFSAILGKIKLLIMKQSEGLVEANVLPVDPSELGILNIEAHPKDFFRNLAGSIVATIGGMAGTSKGEIAMSFSRSVQGVIAGKRFEILANELQEFYKKGRLKDDFERSNAYRNSLSGLLSAIEDAETDDVKFRAIKALFIMMGDKQVGDGQEAEIFSFLKILFKLNTNEILVLLVLGQDDYYEDPARVAKATGLGHAELVDRTRAMLETEKLIPTGRLLLTGLGVAMCEFIAKYDDSIIMGSEVKK